jgi:sulfide:quinone oxidoreductase
MEETRPSEVVIVGGGIAALEAMIALAELAPVRVHVTVVAPGPDFVLPGMKIGESFGSGRRSRVPLARATEDFGASYVPDHVVGVEPAIRAVRCTSGRSLPYDSLILAPGAQARRAFAHAEVVGAESGEAMLHGILADIEEGYVKRLAFVAHGRHAWTLPLYELALLTAEDAWSMGIDDAELTVVTPEEHPLALFGPSASASVSRRLEARGIAFVGGARPDVRRGEVVVHPGDRTIMAQRVFALPEWHGRALPGVPCDARGFVPVDAHGRVPGHDGIFAAGDATAFPIKQGGLAAQQAEAAAQAVAARHGCAIEPEPFRPVLRGRLLTGDGDLFLRNPIAGGAGEGTAGPEAAWWPPFKSAAGRLGPYLYGLEATAPVAG